jgi:Kef-type K+ transport system membrane component KefB
MLILTMGLVICFIFASLAENMGITAIIGAFIAGLFIGRTPQANIIADYIKTIGYAFLSLFSSYGLEQVSTFYISYNHRS